MGERQFVFGRVAGSTEHVAVNREDGPGIAGYQHNAWDGSVSATATPKTVYLNGEK